MSNQSGFTLIEVLTAVAVLTIGILAMQAMQGMSISENTKSGAVTSKSMLAAGQLEIIMAMDYNDPNLTDFDFDGTNQDGNLDGIDDNDNGDFITDIDEDLDYDTDSVVLVDLIQGEMRFRVVFR